MVFMFQRIKKKGLEYLKLAVAQNLGEAQYNMATLYEQGIEIPQNVPKAIYYYKLVQTIILLKLNIVLDGSIIMEDLLKKT